MQCLIKVHKADLYRFCQAKIGRRGRETGAQPKKQVKPKHNPIRRALVKR